MRLLGPTLESVPVARPIPTEGSPQGLCLDRGYDYDACRELAAGQRFDPHVRSRGEEIGLKADHPDWRARRWVGFAGWRITAPGRCSNWSDRA